MKNMATTAPAQQLLNDNIYIVIRCRAPTSPAMESINRHDNVDKELNESYLWLSDN